MFLLNYMINNLKYELPNAQIALVFQLTNL